MRVTSRFSRSILEITAIAAPLLTCGPAFAQIAPADPNTIVQQSGSQFIIDGGKSSIDGQNLFHSFQDFNLTPDQVATFRSNPGLQNIFSRISGGNPSLIQGLLQVTGSNANLFLINPAGIFFGPTARLDLPSNLTVTTAANLGFSNGDLSASPSGSPIAFEFTNPATLLNQGNLQLNPGKTLTLLGGSIQNSGTLSVPGGQILISAIPANQSVQLRQAGSLLAYDLKAIPGNQTASLPQLLTGGQLNPADELVINGDKVELRRQMLPGSAIVTGRLDVSGAEGGKVQILGSNVAAIDGSIAATGASQGGEVLIGGDFQGKGAVPNAERTVVTSSIDVSAIDQGNGGRIILWSDRQTQAGGDAIARAGKQGGNGGFIEVSGKQGLSFTGSVDVAGAKAGTVLFDPEQIIFNERAPISPLSVTPNTVLFNDGPTTATFKPSTFQNLPGNYLFQAIDRITVLSEISGTAPGSFTFEAGRLFEANADINVTNRNITIKAPDVKALNIAAGNGANLKIDANVITVGDLRTDGGNPEGKGGGTIQLNADRAITTEQIFTAGGDVNINTASTQTGIITTNYIYSAGGNISIFGGAGNLGAIGTSPPENRPTGSLRIEMPGSIRTGGLDTTGATTSELGLAGNVSIISTGGGIDIDNINAYAGDGGGNVTISGQTVRIGSTGSGSSIKASGKIDITHFGGPTNQPFVVSDGTGINGTAGAIEVIDINLGIPKALIEKTVSEVPPDGKVTIEENKLIKITAVNRRPEFTSNQPIVLKAPPNETISLTVKELLDGTGTIDRDDDLTYLVLRDVRSPKNKTDRILVNGRLLTGPTRVNLADEITVESKQQLGSQPKFLELLAVDNNRAADLDGYNAIAIALNPTVVVPPPTTPPPVVITPPTTTIPPATPPIIPAISEPPPAVPTPTTGSDTLALEQKLAQEFGQELGLEAAVGNGSESPVEVVQIIEGETGVKPALVYLGFAPLGSETIAQPDRHQLEVTIVTAKGIQRFRSGVDRKTFQKAATKFRSEVTNPLRTHTTSYLDPAQQIYQWIIQPIRSILIREGVNNLVFIPESGLRTLPYAALHSGKGFLVEDYSVGMMPSLSLTDKRYRDLRGDQVLLVGISQATGGLSPLPTVPTEVEYLLDRWKSGKVLLNNDATLANLQAARKAYPYRLIHLATHANFSLGQPSYIQLWNERLKLEDLRELGRNQNVDLLVLSACRTAIGSESAELGFAGLALQTGVKTAVASLWAVSDAGTTALMSQFYASLRQSPIKADALRQAQLALLQGNVRLGEQEILGLPGRPRLGLSEGAVIDDRQLQHPYYWAAFTMIGNPW
jgi:filamentous hemagglutinin family protein